MPTEAPPLYWMLPFAAMLLSIAFGPLWIPQWWHRNSNKFLVAGVLALPVTVYYAARRPAELLATGRDYLSFILLLASLFVISGGIRVTGDLEATPLTNTTFLALGAVLASVLGTTGASMLLIRVLLETNQERTRVKHTVIFFIFLVANIGGLLTPLGDPPLFLGYLLGVPFTWTFRLWRPWLLTVLTLLAVYFVWDSIQHAREPLPALARDRTRRRPLRTVGTVNVLWLAGVVGAVAFLASPWREGAMVGLAALSLRTTSPWIRKHNEFTFYPIAEVAVLFFGIFATMIPALDLLRLRGGELGVREPWQFFWATGALSSFLDNAPTYMTFLALGQGLRLADDVVGVPHPVLMAISMGAVFMGANTYIGNAPNFMLKSIAEERKVAMPSFFGYMAYSLTILGPLFVLLTALFL